MALSVHIKKKLKDFELAVDFDMDEGIVGFLGSSGCGKSMTLKCIAGIETPDEGRIVLDDEVLFDKKSGINLSPQKRKVGYLFQNYALFPHMTVKQNIEAGLAASGKSKQEKKEIVERLLEQFHIKELENSYPVRISGGQRQRVGVARAFATDSDLILMDEPFSALDPLTREELQDEIVKLQKEYQKTIVFVTHDMDEAIKCADKICFIQNGTVIQFDKTEEILRHPANDYVEKFVGKNRLWGNPKYIHASDIMCKEPYTLSKDRTVIQALQVMRQNAINSIFITEGKSRGFLGIVWLEDLSKLDVQHMSASIGDMISSDYVSVYEESSLQEIIDEIDYYKSGIIPVLNERRELKGALTKSILLSTLSKRYKKEQEG